MIFLKENIGTAKEILGGKGRRVVGFLVIYAVTKMNACIRLRDLRIRNPLVLGYHPCQHPSPNIILTAASLSALDLIYKVREFSSPLLSFHFNVEKTNL